MSIFTPPPSQWGCTVWCFYPVCIGKDDPSDANSCMKSKKTQPFIIKTISFFPILFYAFLVISFPSFSYSILILWPRFTSFLLSFLPNPLSVLFSLVLSSFLFIFSSVHPFASFYSFFLFFLFPLSFAFLPFSFILLPTKLLAEMHLLYSGN